MTVAHGVSVRSERNPGSCSPKSQARGAGDRMTGIPSRFTADPRGSDTGVVELEMPHSRAVRKSKQNAPWWLEPGTEVCPACNHTYAIQTEYRCVACDVVICAICVDGKIAAEISCVTCCESPGED